MNCEISFSKPIICESEEVIRLLASPDFYDEDTGQVNFATFNLRTFSNGEEETYLSLSRLLFTDSKHLNKKGKHIFKKTSNNYIGYGILKVADVLHDKLLRLFPVRAGTEEHCGLFYIDNQHAFLSGNLTKYPFMFDSIYTLCSLLEKRLVLNKKQ